MLPISAYADSNFENIGYPFEDLPPLRDVAQKAGIYFGSSAHTKFLRREPEFRALIARECNLLVAEGETKWDGIWPAEDRWTFYNTDWLLDYAESNDMRFRGHTLIWQQSMPAWAIEAIKTGRAEELMETYITTVMGRYKGQFLSWDVVNEAIDPQKNGDLFRNTFWWRALGDNYISKAFHMAAQADPSVKLVYNDFGTEYNDAKGTAKRAGLLKFLRRLRKNKTPIHAVGLQSHLHAYEPFPRKDFIRFCKGVRDLGLDIYITELDVNEGPNRINTKQTDQQSADMTREFLECVWSVQKPKEIVTWGLSDLHTFRRWYSKDDTLRPSPIDDALKRKPMWHEIYKMIAQSV